MKLPLKVSDSHGLCIVDFERKMVAEGNIDEDMKHEAWSADAADFNTIVHYVNTHAALVTALKAVDAFNSDMGKNPAGGWAALMPLVREALKLAEGK